MVVMITCTLILAVNNFISYASLFTIKIIVQFINIVKYEKYVLSNSESVQCNFFIFDHVTFIQFKICCCVQNFIESRLFSLRYGDITIIKMAAVCHLGIVLPPYETTHEVTVAGRSCLSNFLSI